MGEIIDARAAQDLQFAGGGRTQAALAASMFGLVLKVSQDGPISLFRQGAEVLKLPM
jgi:hypothetical protein